MESENSIQDKAEAEPVSQEPQLVDYQVGDSVYLAERADLLGAIRLPDNAFKANANTGVVSDILFLQKRDTPAVEIPKWVQRANNPDGFVTNSYFFNHPDMVLGIPSTEST